MKINLLIISAFLSIVIYANINYQHGITGRTLKNGGNGCTCHSFTSSSSVNVWIEGPDSVYTNDTTQYKILITGGPAVAGGFNIASYLGQLDPVDSQTQILDEELTHTSPNPFLNDTVSWDFIYTAPNNPVIDTIYAVGNSTNGDGNSQPGDQWNFGSNFIITVIDEPLYVDNNNLQPDGFVLYQNYPNPFNPSTTLSFVISQGSFVSLKVFDVLGNEVATLVYEEKPAGAYEVEFNTASINPLPTSGIYFYELRAGKSTETKKMLLLK